MTHEDGSFLLKYGSYLMAWDVCVCVCVCVCTLCIHVPDLCTDKVILSECTGEIA